MRFTRGQFHKPYWRRHFKGRNRVKVQSIELRFLLSRLGRAPDTPFLTMPLQSLILCPCQRQRFILHVHPVPPGWLWPSSNCRCSIYNPTEHRVATVRRTEQLPLGSGDRHRPLKRVIVTPCCCFFLLFFVLFLFVCSFLLLFFALF